MLFLQSEGKDVCLHVVVRIRDSVIFLLIGFDFLLADKLGKGLKSLTFNHGLIGIELDISLVFNCLENFSHTIETQLLDFVAFEETLDINEMIPE